MWGWRRRPPAARRRSRRRAPLRLHDVDLIRIAWWTCRARPRPSAAAAVSSSRGTGKPIENVWTGCVDVRARIAVTTLESTPPDRKAPTGTSASHRIWTASWISAVTSSSVAAPRAGRSWTVQYRRFATPPASKVATSPASSLDTSSRSSGEPGCIDRSGMCGERAGRRRRRAPQRPDLARECDLIAALAEVERASRPGGHVPAGVAPCGRPTKQSQTCRGAGRGRLRPRFIAVGDHLAVGVVRREAMAKALELAPQLAVVIDLAVEHRDNRAVLVRPAAGHRW